MGFSMKAPSNIAFNSPIYPNTTANGFNGIGSSPNDFANSTTSPLGDLDEFDIISKRNKPSNSPPPSNNNGNIFMYIFTSLNSNWKFVSEITLSSDPFNLTAMNDNLPQNTGTVKKTPQSFLGENSALVNLDNLVSASTIKTVAPTPTGLFFLFIDFEK